MTTSEHEAGGAPKAPPPDLTARASRPKAVRLRKSVVQVAVIGGIVLVSGSLAWAFVVQPELRQAARTRAVEDREETTRAVVRPVEAVTDQPASYDRLPPPHGAAEAETAPSPSDQRATGSPSRAAAAPAHYRTGAGEARLTPGQHAARSSLFFTEAQRPAPSAPIVRREAGGQQPVRPDLGAGDYAATYNAHTLTPPLSPYEIKAGATIPAALLTAVDTSRAGPVIAVVTQNTYDTVTGRHLVLPQGTRLIGRAGGDSAYGDRRAFLTWDRLILPNGKSLVLGGGEAATDPQGAIGVRGQVDRRLLPLAMGTLFAGAITALGQAARDDRDTGGGLMGDVGDAASIEAARVGGRVIDRELDLRPVIRLQAGAAVRVMITRDLVLEPYRS